jgi:hypothetical protein
MQRIPRTRSARRQDLDGTRQPVEFDAFLAGVVDLLDAGRRFPLSAPVDAADGFRASRRLTRSASIAVLPAPITVTCLPVAAACRSREIPRAHQVAARKQLVGGKHAVQASRRECP